ncbi:MAG TPA: contractile injection system protein, VgrG/Pvc8 family, partial [Rhodocyclaceae bacterium]|nr:contractile injection system protein, VgrG/Pvc8 family [Rhodocyclaceae bacterium]
MNAPLDSIQATGIALVDQPKLFQHCRIDMPAGSTLTSNAFRLEHFQGQENASDLFEYQLELHGDSDPQADPIDFAQIIGRPITVGIASATFADTSQAQLSFAQALGGEGQADDFALFNGVVASFGIDIPGVYHLTMRPAAWRMTLTNRYRVFRQMCVREVLTTLCREHRVTASFDGLAGEYNLASTRKQDWLQAGETDFEFMRRLMGKAH